MKYLEPFWKYQEVNYDINSEDQYHDLLGQDISEHDDMSEIISDATNNSFIVSDDHFSEDQQQN